MSYYRNIIFVLLLIIVSALQAQQTNLEIFTNLVRTIYSEDLPTVEFDDNSVIVIREHQDSNEFRKILNAELKNWCEERKYNLYTSRFSVPENLHNFIYIFDFTPVQNNVVYGTKKEEINGNVLRSVHVQLLMKIEKSDQVLYNKRITKKYSDNLSADQIDNVETDFFTFTKGKRSQSLISRLFEPVLVSAATGTIIFLFYSFRSN